MLELCLHELVINSVRSPVLLRDDDDENASYIEVKANER
jgi:hypothetical protein